MSWYKLHSDIIDDPKMEELSDKEFRILSDFFAYVNETEFRR